MSADSRTRILTKYLKGIDEKLYAVREKAGLISVYRESKRLEYFEYEGQTYAYARSAPHFILALTHNWTPHGRPVEWGIDPLMSKMQEIDSWNKGRTVEHLIAEYEKSDASKDRARMNNHEAWLRDNRSIFKKAFNDINTSNLNVKERGIQNGNL